VRIRSARFFSFVALPPHCFIAFSFEMIEVSSCDNLRGANVKPEPGTLRPDGHWQRGERGADRAALAKPSIVDGPDETAMDRNKGVIR
jgi:hypothetical protein